MEKEELKGKLNRAKGAAKEKVGELTDNPDLQAEGAADKLRGNAQEAFGGAKRKAKDTLEDLTKE
jgi:uncharacterized protein YjbJ (UPF0337 family)